MNNKGETVTAYLYWYKGDAIQAAKELVASVPENPGDPGRLSSRYAFGINLMIRLEKIYQKLILPRLMHFILL